MAEPHIAQKAPYQADLEPGTYWYCTCGHSANQPFCDGSHKGSEFVPMKFELAEAKSVHLCGCKHTKNAPYCDGTHKTL